MMTQEIGGFSPNIGVGCSRFRSNHARDTAASHAPTISCRPIISAVCRHTHDLDSSLLKI
jgi:hypothetical protein